MTPEQLREFFQLAAVWLSCRLKGMDPSEPDPMWVLLGELDYHAELELLIREARRT